MKKILSLLVILPCIALAEVEVKTEVYEVIEVKQDNGSSKLEWVTAQSIVPGDRVGYRIRFENTGKDPADNIVLNNPVPENTIYVDGSARGANSKIVYSVNGGHLFGTPKQLFIEKEGKKMPATAKDYTNIRWTLSSPLKAGEQGSVQYVVQVK